MAEASSPAPVPVPVPEASGPGLTTAEWEAVDSLLYTIYTAKADEYGLKCSSHWFGEETDEVS